jgi:hypothetical protein
MQKPIGNEQHATETGVWWAELTEAKRKLRERINQGQYGKSGQAQSTVLDDARSLVSLIETTKNALSPENLDWRTPANGQAEADYLSACCWAAEGLEYFGRTDEVRDWSRGKANGFWRCWTRKALTVAMIGLRFSNAIFCFTTPIAAFTANINTSRPSPSFHGVR